MSRQRLSYFRRWATDAHGLPAGKGCLREGAACGPELPAGVSYRGRELRCLALASADHEPKDAAIRRRNAGTRFTIRSTVLNIAVRARLGVPAWRVLRRDSLTARKP